MGASSPDSAERRGARTPGVVAILPQYSAHEQTQISRPPAKTPDLALAEVSRRDGLFAQDPSAAMLRSFAFMILPVGVSGSDATTTKRRGAL